MRRGSLSNRNCSRWTRAHIGLIFCFERAPREVGHERPHKRGVEPDQRVVVHPQRVGLDSAGQAVHAGDRLRHMLEAAPRPRVARQRRRLIQQQPASQITVLHVAGRKSIGYTIVTACTPSFAPKFIVRTRLTT